MSKCDSINDAPKEQGTEENRHAEEAVGRNREGGREGGGGAQEA